jgi:hypothetical protein
VYASMLGFNKFDVYCTINCLAAINFVVFHSIFPFQDCLLKCNNLELFGNHTARILCYRLLVMSESFLVFNFLMPNLYNLKACSSSTLFSKCFLKGFDG